MGGSIIQQDGCVENVIEHLMQILVRDFCKRQIHHQRQEDGNSENRETIKRSFIFDQTKKPLFFVYF